MAGGPLLGAWHFAKSIRQRANHTRVISSRVKHLRAPHALLSERVRLSPLPVGGADAHPQSTGAIPCAAFCIVAAWIQRRTVRTLKSATAASRRSRSLGTRRSRTRELALVAVCLTHAGPIRSRQLAAARTLRRTRRSVTLKTSCRDGALCRTTHGIPATSHSSLVTRPFLPVTASRVELPLTLSKQRTAMRSTRHSNEGGAGARLEAKI